MNQTITPKDWFHTFLNHGREAQLPIDIMYGPPPGQPQSQSQSQFARNLVSKMDEAFKTARETLAQAHRRQKENYDAQVWLHNPVSIRRKLAPCWLGPYIIKKRLEYNGNLGVTYWIQEEDGRGHQVVHHNCLKPCYTPVSPAKKPKVNEEIRDYLPDSSPLLVLDEPFAARPSKSRAGTDRRSPWGIRHKRG